MVRLHLLDATFELFRAYYAMPPERAPDGREVGAVRGIISTTLSLLQSGDVTHLAAATDQVIESFRNDLFVGYKTGDGIPPDLWAQFPLAEDALQALGVALWPMTTFEADDALATAAHRFADRVDQVVILSPDKDLAQCVSGDRVVLYDRLRGRLYDEAGVREKFGVSPASIPDFLALVGDSADGLPGVLGWGPKSAAIMLSRYGTIEAFPSDPLEWPVALRQRTRLAAALGAVAAEAQLYKKLATLRRDVPIQEDLADLEWRGVPRLAYERLCRELGFANLLERPKRWAAV
jgi:5'-3' exonuclease